MALTDSEKATRIVDYNRLRSDHQMLSKLIDAAATLHDRSNAIFIASFCLAAQKELDKTIDVLEAQFKAEEAAQAEVLN